MDIGSISEAHFWSGLLNIVIIDLVLAGDNAVVIAMAVRHLPPKKKRQGIIFGAGAAVLLRVMLTFFVSQLLILPYVKLGGGLLIIWVAIKLFAGEGESEEAQKEASTIWEAIKIIVIADITMSTDNMLAVGGASHGNLFLLLFGLGLSIPFIVFTSDLLSRAMARYPIIAVVGAAVLGRVAAQMIFTDPFVTSHLGEGKVLLYGTEVLFAAAIAVYGWMKVRAGQAQRAAKASTAPVPSAAGAPEQP